MVSDGMGLVVRLHKLMNRLSVPDVNPTIRIPNHHEFHIVFIQSQKTMHHENWTCIPNMAKNDLGKGCQPRDLLGWNIRTQLHKDLPIRKVSRNQSKILQKTSLLFRVLLAV
jgi:hypothetical protein